jgi:hypothetical protein
VSVFSGKNPVGVAEEFFVERIITIVKKTKYLLETGIALVEVFTGALKQMFCCLLFLCICCGSHLEYLYE